MEKLLFSRLINLVFIVLPWLTLAQEKAYCVFKTIGKPTHNNASVITKGQFLKSGNVKLSNNDELLLLDEQGTLYKLDKPATYSHAEISNHQANEEVTSFSKKYFTYVWKQFTKSDRTKEHTGVVYRSTPNASFQPLDSTNVYLPEIEFSWLPKENQNKTYYFNIKEINSDSIIKIGITDTKLTLFVDYKILTPGKVYQWAVSDKKFPDLDKIQFKTLKLLSEDEFKVLKESISDLKTDLEKLGLTNQEIKNIIYNDYKLLY